MSGFCKPIALGLLVAAISGPLPGHAQEPPGGDPAATRGPALVPEAFGDVDYDWRIRSLDEGEKTLAAYRGEVLFINLWASWCTPCIRELGSIERLRSRLGDAQVQFLIVAAERESSVRRFLRRYDYDLPFFVEISRIPSAFGMRGIPTSWVVDRAGRIVLTRHGEAVWDTEEVAALLKGLAEGADR